MIHVVFALAAMTVLLGLMATTVGAVVIPDQILNGIGGIIELILESRFWIPWATVLVCIGWLIALYNMRFLMSIVNWVKSLIP